MTSLRPLDVVIFLLFLSLAIGSAFFAAGENQGVHYVAVETSETVYYLPLSEDGELRLHGPIGDTIVTVENGAARVSASDCRDKTCITMGTISRQSAWIACLPNKVFLRIVSRGRESGMEVDAGAY